MQIFSVTELYAEKLLNQFQVHEAKTPTTKKEIFSCYQDQAIFHFVCVLCGCFFN